VRVDFQKPSLAKAHFSSVCKPHILFLVVTTSKGHFTQLLQTVFEPVAEADYFGEQSVQSNLLF